MDHEPEPLTVSRRGVLAGGAASATLAATPLAAQSSSAMPQPTPPTIPVTLKVNGRTSRLELDTRTTLLDALRAREAV